MNACLDHSDHSPVAIDQPGAAVGIEIVETVPWTVGGDPQEVYIACSYVVVHMVHRGSGRLS